LCMVGDANGSDVACNVEPFVIGGVFDRHGVLLGKWVSR
jgi:hypothetical protein